MPHQKLAILDHYSSILKVLTLNLSQVLTIYLLSIPTWVIVEFRVGVELFAQV